MWKTVNRARVITEDRGKIMDIIESINFGRSLILNINWICDGYFEWEAKENQCNTINE